eukprot:7355622-Ditylum_brightwellii.AAC.1
MVHTQTGLAKCEEIYVAALCRMEKHPGTRCMDIRIRIFAPKGGAIWLLSAKRIHLLAVHSGPSFRSGGKMILTSFQPSPYLKRESVRDLRGFIRSSFYHTGDSSLLLKCPIRNVRA